MKGLLFISSAAIHDLSVGSAHGAGGGCEQEEVYFLLSCKEGGADSVKKVGAAVLFYGLVEGDGRFVLPGTEALNEPFGE